MTAKMCTGRGLPAKHYRDVNEIINAHPSWFLEVNIQGLEGDRL